MEKNLATVIVISSDKRTGTNIKALPNIDESYHVKVATFNYPDATKLKNWIKSKATQNPPTDNEIEEYIAINGTFRKFKDFLRENQQSLHDWLKYNIVNQEEVLKENLLEYNFNILESKKKIKEFLTSQPYRQLREDRHLFHFLESNNYTRRDDFLKFIPHSRWAETILETFSEYSKKDLVKEIINEKKSKRFNQAVDELENLQQQLSREQALQLYGLYKQATQGDVKSNRPGEVDQKHIEEWESWNSMKGMSLEEAKEQYVKTARSILPKNKLHRIE